MTVLRGFVAGANAQYRAAGLGEYQMHVDSKGRVSTPNAPAPKFKPVSGTGNAASAQAADGASASSSTASASAAPAGDAPAAARAGAAPTLTGLKPTADGFTMTWQPVKGATKYGIYVDGKLVGHVPKPTFTGTIPAGTGGVMQVDAVAANGTRTAMTAPIRLDMDASGKLSASDPNAAEQGAATAPAAAGS